MMIKAEILSVGTELTSGSVLDTNAQFLAKRLGELGIIVLRETTLPDQRDVFKQAMKRAIDENDIVIITGGLGPTADDLTKESLAELLNLELQLNQNWLEHIYEFFRMRGRTPTDNNIKQAYIPSGATIIDNPHGSACGIFLEESDTAIFLLPGVPHEMKQMFDDKVSPILKDFQTETIKNYDYKLTGIGESDIESQILDLVNEQDQNKSIATYASPGEVLLRLQAKNGIDISDWNKIIDQRLGEYIFTHHDENLYQTVGRYLISHNISISTAESCTGGLVGEMLTRIPNISSVYKLGVISYSNEAKEKVLNIDADLIKTYSAVSSEVCKMMCENVRDILSTDIGISVTGYAGPKEADEPVGLVYIGICTEDYTEVKEFHFNGTREDIRNLAANRVFALIRKKLFKIFD